MSIQIKLKHPNQFFNYDETTKTLTLLENVKIEKIPEGVENLVLSDMYNSILPKLPNSLTHLTMGSDFNQQITLPPTLTHLLMGYWFNQLITLPPTLTHLTMGYKFNQHITLPPTLTHLTTGGMFNQQITLPPTLTHLIIGYYFYQQITLPQMLKFVYVINPYFFNTLEKKNKTLYVYCIYKNYYDKIKYYMNGKTSDVVNKNIYKLTNEELDIIYNSPEFQLKSKENQLQDQVNELQKKLDDYKLIVDTFKKLLTAV